jgi:hypothetical protein
MNSGSYVKSLTIRVGVRREDVRVTHYGIGLDSFPLPGLSLSLLLSFFLYT